MTLKTDGERLAVLETQSIALNKKLDVLDASIGGLHTKMDGLLTTLSSNFVSKGEFEEWKKARSLERILIILVTSAITGLVSFFIQKGGF